MTATEKKPQQPQSVRRPKKPARPKKPKIKKCPQCEVMLQFSEDALTSHFIRAHGRSPTRGEFRQFNAARKRKPRNSANKIAVSSTGKRKKKTSRKNRKLYVDRSIFAKNGTASLTPEQQAAQDRINSRGFHEGASVPGSSIRKIDK
jgi:hypothetical protein